MIYYNHETDFILEDQEEISQWIITTIKKEKYKVNEISCVFCTDAYLLEKNIKYLNHSTLTDVISFDYSVDKLISGDIFISIERVIENASTFKVSFKEELHRVIIHGILHYCGYKDKTENDKKEMRAKEDYYLSLRNF